jgi:hypothetical protein
LHRGSSISITTSSGRFLRLAALSAAAVMLAQSAGRWLFNVAHFVLALIQIAPSQCPVGEQSASWLAILIRTWPG